MKHLPLIYLPSDLLWESRNNLVAMELPCIVFTSKLGYSAEVVQALWLIAPAVFGIKWIKLLTPCMTVHFFFKSALNKLVCTFDRMENSFSLSCKRYTVPIGFIVIFTFQIYFKLTWIHCTSTFHRCDPYSFWNTVRSLIVDAPKTKT